MPGRKNEITEVNQLSGGLWPNFATCLEQLELSLAASQRRLLPNNFEVLVVC